jgi:hypothetical protein
LSCAAARGARTPGMCVSAHQANTRARGGLHTLTLRQVEGTARQHAPQLSSQQCDGSPTETRPTREKGGRTRPMAGNMKPIASSKPNRTVRPSDARCCAMLPSHLKPEDAPARGVCVCGVCVCASAVERDALATLCVHAAAPSLQPHPARRPPPACPALLSTQHNTTQHNTTQCNTRAHL